MEQIDGGKTRRAERRERQERGAGQRRQNPRDDGLRHSAQVEIAQRLTSREQVVQERALAHAARAQGNALRGTRIGFPLEFFIAVEGEHMREPAVEVAEHRAPDAAGAHERNGKRECGEGRTERGARDDPRGSADKPNG